MTDKEILLALSNIIEPVIADIQEIKVDLRRLEENTERKFQVVEQKLQTMDQRLQVVEQKLDTMDHRQRKIELMQENDIIPRLSTIEACYTSTYERYKGSVDEHDNMKEDISILKEVVTEHRIKLQKIS